jgi:hypothetical protein
VSQGKRRDLKGIGCLELFGQATSGQIPANTLFIESLECAKPASLACFELRGTIGAAPPGKETAPIFSLTGARTIARMIESGRKSLRHRFALIFGSSRKAMTASGPVSEHDPECASNGCSDS